MRSVVLVSSEVEIFQRLQLVDRSWNFPREIVGVHRKDLRIGGAPAPPKSELAPMNRARASGVLSASSSYLWRLECPL